MSETLDLSNRLTVIQAGIEARCAEITVKRNIKSLKLAAELVKVNGHSTWLIERDSFNKWQATRGI